MERGALWIREVIVDQRGHCGSERSLWMGQVWCAVWPREVREKSGVNERATLTNLSR